MFGLDASLAWYKLNKGRFGDAVRVRVDPHQPRLQLKFYASLRPKRVRASYKLYS